MKLINEIQFIELNENEVIMLNLINGATDLLEKDIYQKIINKNFNNIDKEIIGLLKERCYLFDKDEEYHNFIHNMEKVIEDYELKSPPSFSSGSKLCL